MHHVSWLDVSVRSSNKEVMVGKSWNYCRLGVRPMPLENVFAIRSLSAQESQCACKMATKVSDAQIIILTG